MTFRTEDAMHRAANILLVLPLFLLLSCGEAPTDPEQTGAGRPNLGRSARGGQIARPPAPRFMLGSGGSDTVVLDFEGIPDLTQVAAAYAGVGVTFSSALVLRQGGSLNHQNFPPRSGVGVVDNEPTATITVDFADPTPMAGGYVTGWINTNVTLRCFDSAGVELGSDVLPEPNCVIDCFGSTPPNFFLSVEAPGIKQCTVSDTCPNAVTLDDFTFVYEADPAVVCTPDPVQRGEDVTCSIIGATVDDVIKWEFDEGPGGFKFTTTTHAEAQWQGTAVLGGEVEVTAKINGQQKKEKFSDSFVVDDRPWTWDERAAAMTIEVFDPDIYHVLFDAPGVPNPFHDLEPTLDPGTTVIGGWNCKPSDCGYVRRVQPDLSAFPDSGYSLDEVEQGPNQTLWYVSQATFFTDAVSSINKQFRPGGRKRTLPAGAQADLCRVAMGLDPTDPVDVNFYTFNDECETGVSPDSLIAGILRHEGLGTVLERQGHEGRSRQLARDAAGALDVYRYLDTLVTISETALRDAIRNDVEDMQTTIHDEGRDEANVGQNFCVPIWMWSDTASAYVKYLVHDWPFFCPITIP